MLNNQRLKAFCTDDALEIFSPIIRTEDIFQSDAFDLDIIHSEARATYKKLFDRLNSSENLYSGRILLLLGETASGKTHLTQAFRNYTHQNNLGYVSYIKMTPQAASSTNYALYMLNAILNSLSKVYHLPNGEDSGLMRLSNAIVEDPQLGVESIRIIREEQLSPRHLAALVYNVVNKLAEKDRFKELDVDLMRALIYLQSNDPTISTIIFKYLCCNPLSASESQALGGLLTPHFSNGDPEYLLQSLAKLIYALDTGALVICLDQLEDMRRSPEPEAQYQKAIQTAITLAQQPNVIVVMTSTSEVFENSIRQALPGFYLELIEKNPEKITLKSGLADTEIAALIKLRLAKLFSDSGITLDERNSLYPFPKATPQYLAGKTIYDVLNWCNKEREKSIRTGQAPILDEFEDPELASESLLTVNLAEQQDDDLKTDQTPVLYEPEDFELVNEPLSTIDLLEQDDGFKTGQTPILDESEDFELVSEPLSAIDLLEQQDDDFKTDQVPILDEHKSFELSSVPLPILDLSKQWDDHLIKFTEVSLEKESILSLFEWALKQYNKETTNGLKITARQQNQQLAVDILTANGQENDQLQLRVCNKRASGGALAKEIKELAEAAQGCTPVAIRFSDFPSNPKTKIAKIIDKFLNDGGKCVVVTDDDLQTMNALQNFLEEHSEHPEFEAWHQTTQPLSNLPSLKQLLDLEQQSTQFSEA